MDKIYELGETIIFNDSKFIFLDLKGSDNIISLSLKNSHIHQIYKNILAHDYIFYAHKDGISKFCKRKNVGELFGRKDLINEGDLYYTLESPVGRKKIDSFEKKLLVIFPCMPCMPENEEFSNPRIPARMLYNFFGDIPKSLFKNTYIMRIMDLNLSHGSYFVNTSNYPDFESDIQNAINRVINDLAVSKENTVFYGYSKGALGALYHGSKMDFNVLSIDPVIDMSEYVNSGDTHFLEGFRKNDFTDDINSFLISCEKKNKIVFCSKNSPYNYKTIQNLNVDKLKIFSFEDEHILSHSFVCNNTIPEQLTVLNNFFSHNSFLTDN